MCYLNNLDHVFVFDGFANWHPDVSLKHSLAETAA